MRNQRWMVMALLLVVALVLAACPAGGPAPAAPAEDAAPAAEATEAPAEEAAPEAEATEAPAEESVEEAAVPEGPALVIWADDTRARILQDLGAQFTEQYGIPVVVTEKAFGDVRDDAKVAAPTGEGPDLFIGAHDWLGELVESGIVAEVDLADKSDLFLDAAVQAFVYDGVLYGMPYATENVAFVYNPEMVTDVPTTWSEVTETAAALEEASDNADFQGYIIQANDPYHFFPVQTAFGGYVFGLTEDGYDPTDVGIDSEGSIAAITWLDQMYKDGHLKAGSAVNYDIMHASYEAGNAAMMITGPWALPRIRESGIPYAVAALPGEVEEAKPFLGVQGFMINAFSDDPLLAQTFLQEFIATDEAMQAIFDADPRPSAFLSVRDAIEDPDIAGFAAAGANGLAMPAIPEMSAVWSAWGDAMELVSQQNEAPDTAFINAAEQIRAAIAGE